MSETLLFLVGDSNGTERCVNITIEDDMLVECEEEFNVTLTIAAEKPNVIVHQSTTVVSIIDNDGMTPCEPYIGHVLTTSLSYDKQRLSSQCRKQLLFRRQTPFSWHVSH